MLNKFREKMAEYGFETDIIPDGNIHRFRVGAKGQSGWYVCYSENSFVAGSFGDWKSGLSVTFSDFEKSNYDHTEFHKKVEQIKLKAEEEKKRANEEAEKKANSIWNQAGPCHEHPYLSNKKVKSHGLKIFNNSLVVPVKGSDKKIKSLQFISEDGSKKFLSGGAMKGSAFSIPGETDIIYICEGYSTGATIAEQTGNCVICAFNAGNIIEVAKKIRSKNKDVEIVICCDNDRKNEINVGVEKGKEAAQLVNGKVAIPEFPGEEGTDFNDLHNIGVDILQFLTGIDNGLYQDVKKFVQSTNGKIRLSELNSHFGFSDKSSKDIMLKIVNQLCKNNILKKDRIRSFTYKVVRAEEEKQNLDSEPIPLNIHLPFFLEDFVTIYKKTIIVIAGESNTGKTAASFDCLASNISAGHRNITYYSSEMSIDEYKSRAAGINPNMSFWENADFYDRNSDFADLITGEKKDGIHIIDYLEPLSEGGYAGIERDITEIWEELRDGVAIINLQKTTGMELARGGDGTKAKSRLYISLSQGYRCADDGWVNICKIIKSKIPKHPMQNVDGKSCFYRASKRGIEILSAWQYMNFETQKHFIKQLQEDIPAAENTVRSLIRI